MDFKPFPLHVGYDTRITEYVKARRGKVPKFEIMDWLHENVGMDGWQFDWQYPETTDPTSVQEMGEFIEQVRSSTQASGGTFYFDSEEDRLLFCLKWFNGDDDTIMWHPV
jgi:hypothetical protein